MKSHFSHFGVVPSSNMHLLTLLPPQLLRTHKRPQQYEEGSAPGFQHDAPEPITGRINFEAIDNALSTIRSRFYQPRFQMYRQSDNLLLKSIHNESVEEELRAVTSFDGVDLDAAQLKVQLSLPSSCDLKDVVTYQCSFSSAEQVVLSQVSKLIQLILVNPATNESVSDHLMP